MNSEPVPPWVSLFRLLVFEARDHFGENVGDFDPDRFRVLQLLARPTLDFLEVEEVLTI